MSVKQGKLITGFKSLLGGSFDYEYKYNQNSIYQCSIKQLYGEQLQIKYPSITIESLVDEFHQYLSLPAELLGKRSSEIIISASRKFCCKLVDEESLGKIMEILEDVWFYEQQHKETFLTPIYRIFRVQSSKDNFRQTDTFILMPCLRPKFQEIVAIYDLKGHTEGRCLNVQDFNIFKFGKDENFIVGKELNLIQSLQKSFREQFTKKFISDVKFLQSKNIIDYSLLLVFRDWIQNEQFSNNSIVINNKLVMQWGIIDYFQQYNTKKKAQNKFKSFFKKELSSIQPQLYSERFIKFIKKYLLLAA